jgi:membrane associated rhomboid family serine protease
MGASGGIYGLMMVYAVLFPERELLFMMMFPLKTKHFVMLISAIEFLQLASSPRSGGGLGAIAHLSGLGAGWVFLRLQAKGFKLDFERKLKSSTPSKKRSNHLKLVQDRDEDDRNNKGPKTWH